jgi:glutaredoxin 3
MNNRRWVGLVLLVVIAATLLAGCSGNNTPGATPTQTINYTTAAHVVKVYTAPGWSYCVKVKEFLDKNNIVYQEFNVAEDERAYQEMFSQTRSSAVPQINIDGQMIVGFQEKLLKQKLGIP